MAKKKKHGGHHRRRRRVGALALNPGSQLTKLLAVAAGYFLVADPLNTALDKALPTSITAATDMKKYIPGAAEAGVGLVLLTKGRGGMVKTLAGGILIGAGIKRLLRNAGMVTGYQNTPVIGRRMAGYQKTPVLGATDIPSQLNGVPSQLSGYRVNGPGYIPHGSGAKVMGSTGHGSGITNSGSDYMN